MGTITTKGLTKKFGKLTAVDDLDLDIKEGEIFGLLGPNGAGKTTTISMLATLLAPTSGTATVANQDILKNPSKVREHIGIVFQDPSSDDILTGRENLYLHGLMYGVPRSIIPQRIDDAFDLVQLTGREDDLVKTYSGGMRRRLELARGLLHHPEILFLDEPTVGLDPTARRKLLDFLRDKVKKSGLTIFYTTHVLSEAEYLCDKIAIINNGKIMAVDSPSELKNRFGYEKTIKIHISTVSEELKLKLFEIPECQIKLEPEPTVVITSTKSEIVLFNILKILNETETKINDLSAIPTNLEEIFLKVVGDSN